MKRRTVFLLCGGLALVVLTGILAQLFPRTRPFKDLTAEDIQAVKLELFPPSAEFSLTPEEIEELAPLLNDVVVYRRDDSWRDYRLIYLNSVPRIGVWASVAYTERRPTCILLLNSCVDEWQERFSMRQSCILLTFLLRAGII